MNVALELPAPPADRPAPPKAETSGRGAGGRFQDRLGEVHREQDAAETAGNAVGGEREQPRPETPGSYRHLPFLFADEKIAVGASGEQPDPLQSAQAMPPAGGEDEAAVPAAPPMTAPAAAQPTATQPSQPADSEAATATVPPKPSAGDIKPERTAAPAAAEAPVPHRQLASEAGQDGEPAFDLELGRAANQTLQSGSAETKIQAAAPPAARTMPEMVPLDQVAVHIAKSATKGFEKIQIHLTPASLGTIDVDLEFGHDGRVDIVVRADKPETVELLQRDARQLVRALQDAGLQAGGGNLSFELSDQSNGQERPAGQSSRSAGEDGGIPGGGPAESVPQHPTRRLMPGGVDIIA